MRRNKIRNNKIRNRNKNESRIRFCIILLILTICMIGIVNSAAADPEKTNYIVSDSVSPLKLEVETGSSTAETETKIVTLTNTGETTTEYIFYVERSRGTNTSNSSSFGLSETKTAILPGETYKLEISIPASLIQNSTDEYKLKIVRNPETQTPVGYIIPILTAASSENGSGNGSKNNGSNSAAISGNANNSGSETGRETENPKTAYETNESEKQNESKDFNDGNFFTKRNGILFSLVILLIISLAIGIWIQKRK